MATTYTLISSVTVGAGGASSIDFTSIPSTYTDLVLKLSARDNRTGTNYTDDVRLRFNGSSTGYSNKVLYGGGGSAGSFGGSSMDLAYGGYAVGTDGTANTFGNSEIYIPNYTGSNNKSISVDGVAESNSSTGVYAALEAGLWGNSAAITSIALTPVNGTTWLQNSTAYLYGIKNN